MPFKSEAQKKWMWTNHPKMAKKWEKETKTKNLPKKLKKKAQENQIDQFNRLISSEVSTDPFGPKPDLLPANNVQTYLKVMNKIYQDSSLSGAEKNQLIAKLRERKRIPDPEKSTTGVLLGAGLGTGLAALLSSYLLKGKSNLSPSVKGLLGLGLLAAGAMGGGRIGGRAFSTEARIIDPRRQPEEERYSPWKIMI